MADDMQKVKFDRKIDGALSKLISEGLNNYSCQLFKRVDGKIAPEGSGVLAEINNQVLLLTAAHVTENMSDGNQLFFKIHSGYVSVVGDLQETDIDENKTIDLAYVILDKAVVKELKKGHKFLPLNKFRSHLKLLDAAQYCIIGFPEKKQLIEEGKLKTGSSAYFLKPSKDKVYKYLKFNKTACFIFDFKGKGSDIKTGKINKISTDVHGISGCGIWLCILTQVGENIETDYRLIGIMTECRKGKYHCLIGNRIELILQQLKKTGIINYKEIKADLKTAYNN